MTEIISPSKTDLDAAAKLAKANAAIWAQTYLKTEAGQPFSFARHVYQIEPMTLEHPDISVKKGTQGGFTLMFIIKAAFSLIHRRIPQGVIYLFPTDTKVQEFSALRWTPLIDNNATAIGGHVGEPNNVHYKRIGAASLIMLGAELPKTIAGQDRESASLRSSPADIVVYDELDLMPPYSVNKAHGRLGHSELGWEWSLSNPTIPGYGIDARWESGDQRHWMVRCDGCNDWWCLEIEFPQILRKSADGKVYRACLKCGRELNIDRGQWVAKFPARSKDRVSYWWSQLNSHAHTARPSELLRRYENPPEGNLGDVLRLDHGRAYLDAQSGLTTVQVLACCGREPPAASSPSIPTAIGVDVGAKLHVVIGYRVKEDIYRVIAMLLLDTWPQLRMAAAAFRAQVTSIDNEPELRGARDYQGSGPGQVWLSDYVESVSPVHYDPNTGMVRVNRTEILDETHWQIVTPGKLILPAAGPAIVTQFAEECCHLARIIKKNPATGEQTAMYVKTGADHFRHAFANFLLAAKRQCGIIPPTASASVPSKTGDNRGPQGYDLFAT